MLVILFSVGIIFLPSFLDGMTIVKLSEMNDISDKYGDKKNGETTEVISPYQYKDESNYILNFSEFSRISSNEYSFRITPFSKTGINVST